MLVHCSNCVVIFFHFKYTEYYFFTLYFCFEIFLYLEAMFEAKHVFLYLLRSCRKMIDLKVILP